MGLYDNYKTNLSQPISMYVGNSLEDRGKALSYFATLDEVANQKLDGLQELITKVPHNKVDEGTLSGLVAQANDLMDKRSDGKSIALGYEGISNAVKELTRRIKPISQSAAAYQADMAANDAVDGWSLEDKNAIHAYNAKNIKPITYNPDGTVTGGYTSGYKLPKYEDPINYLYKQLSELHPNTFKSVTDLETYLTNSKTETINAGVNLSQIDNTIANLLNGSNPLANYIGVKTFADTQNKLGELKGLSEEGIQNAIDQGLIPQDKVAELVQNKDKGISYMDTYTSEISKGVRNFHIQNFLNLGAAKAYTEHTQVQEVGQPDQEKRALDMQDWKLKHDTEEADKKNFELWKDANGVGGDGKDRGTTYTGEFATVVANDYQDLSTRMNENSTTIGATQSTLAGINSSLKTSAPDLEKLKASLGKDYESNPQYKQALEEHQNNLAKKHNVELQLAIQNERQAVLLKSKQKAIENALTNQGSSYQAEMNSSKDKAKIAMSALGINNEGLVLNYRGQKAELNKDQLAEAMAEGRVTETVEPYQESSGITMGTMGSTTTRYKVTGTKITTKDGKEFEIPLSNPYGKLGTIGVNSYNQRSDKLKKAEETAASDKSKIMTTQMGLRLSDKYMESIPVNSQNYRGADGLPTTLPENWDLTGAKREMLTSDGRFVSVSGIKDKDKKDVGTKIFELPQNSNAPREIVKKLSSSSDPGYKAMGDLMATPYYSKLQELTQGYKSSVDINGVNLHKEGESYYITDARGNYIPNPATKSNYYNLEEISTTLLKAHKELTK